MKECKHETGEQCDRDFEDVPQDRVFFEMKLFLDLGGNPMGKTIYRGDALKNVGVDKITAKECYEVANLTSRAAQKAINLAGMLAQTVRELMGIFGEEDKGDDKDSEQTGDGSGGGEANASAGQRTEQPVSGNS
jgi:hypothetical protein